MGQAAWVIMQRYFLRLAYKPDRDVTPMLRDLMLATLPSDSDELESNLDG